MCYMGLLESSDFGSEYITELAFCLCFPRCIVSVNIYLYFVVYHVWKVMKFAKVKSI
jgi:hypothetical protein